MCSVDGLCINEASYYIEVIPKVIVFACIAHTEAGIETGIPPVAYTALPEKGGSDGETPGPQDAASH